MALPVDTAVPAAQLVQGAFPDDEYVPAEHGVDVQEVAPGELAEAQVGQTVAPVALLKVPTALHTEKESTTEKN